MNWMILIYFFSFTLPQQIEWINYTNEDQLYSVLVPALMENTEKYIETSTGDYFLRTDYLQSSIDKTENKLYLINYHTIQQDLYAVDSIQSNTEFLITMANDIALSMDGELLYTNPVVDKSWQSIEYRVKFGPDESNMKGKLVLTPTHLFSLQVYSTKQYSLNKNMDRFLSSFRLL